MAKTHLRTNVRSSLKSIKDLPFTGVEIKEMEEIQEKDYWQRKPLKEQFCDRNNRMISEVNEYFKKHKKTPLGGSKGEANRKAKQQGKKAPMETSSSIRAPREQVTSIPMSAGNGEIRITFKELRVEGNQMIFKV
jgi:hypothetical protein